MLALCGWLKSRAHCSYSTIATWMDDVLQVPVSRGYLAKLCNGPISASLADRFQTVERTDGSHYYDMSQDYFRFMFASGVEPTNDHTEQQVRHCVIDRRHFYKETRRKGSAAPDIHRSWPRRCTISTARV